MAKRTEISGLRRLLGQLCYPYCIVHNAGVGSEVTRMTRLLLSLPELELRVNWLREHLDRWPAHTIAVRLEKLCARSERCEPGAREAMLAVACYFAATGECELVRALRDIAAEQHLLSLGRMLRWGQLSRDRGSERPQSRPPSLQEVPDYGAGRELTVGERRSLARRPSRANIDRLLADPHPLVLRELLLNPFLVEADIVRLAARRPAHVVGLEVLARSPHWLCRGRVRLAMVQNPGTPRSISGPLLVVFNRCELAQVAANTAVPTDLRATARELLAWRPPLRGAVDHMLQ